MATYGSTIPGASGYAGAALLAQKAYANAMARYNQQRSGTLLRYGYKRNADGSYGVDANNEFGQYQQMLRGENQQHEQLGRAQAASGWGGDSGYLGAQQEDLAHAQGGEQTALGTSLMDELSGITQGEQQASYDKDAALYQAQEEAAQKAIDNQQFNPGDYTGLDKRVTDPASRIKPVPKPTRRVAPVKHRTRQQRLVQRQAARRAAQKKGRRRR